MKANISVRSWERRNIGRVFCEGPECLLLDSVLSPVLRGVAGPLFLSILFFSIYLSRNRSPCADLVAVGLCVNGCGGGGGGGTSPSIH